MAESIPLRTLSVGQWKYQFIHSPSNKTTNGSDKPVKYGGVLVLSSGEDDCLEIDVWQEDKKEDCSDPLGTITASKISGIDVSLSSEFLDTMELRVLIETEIPITFEEDEQNVADSGELDHKLAFTCDVTYAGHIRDVLQNIRYTKFNEAIQNEKEGTKVDKIAWKEGLPNWVSYVPSSWYNRNVRLWIETLFVVYTLLSVAWAVWQLYRNVPVIQAALAPLVEFLRYRLDIIVRFLDHAFDWWTNLWMDFFRPFAVLYTATIVPVGALFAPVARLLPSLPIQSIKIFMQNVIRPVSALLRRVPWLSMWVLAKRFAYAVWTPLAKLGHYLRRFQVALTGFDPQVARLQYARMLLVNGFKTIGTGTAVLAKRAYTTTKNRKGRKRELEKRSSDKTKEE
ncbi:uncharacterized protein [Oscarella lobularis]|uniref:uncharacterized protein n=1 Tax=Oscarella lobularis TaxID=121494 RepID=UPI003313D041